MQKIKFAFEPFMPEDEQIDFPDDCRRIQKAFARNGYQVTELQASELWSEYSQRMFAGWLYLPSDGDEIFKCLAGLWAPLGD